MLGMKYDAGLGACVNGGFGASTDWLVFCCCCWHSLNLVHVTLRAKALVPAAWPVNQTDAATESSWNVEIIDYLYDTVAHCSNWSQDIKDKYSLWLSCRRGRCLVIKGLKASFNSTVPRYPLLVAIFSWHLVVSNLTGLKDIWMYYVLICIYSWKDANPGLSIIFHSFWHGLFV